MLAISKLLGNAGSKFGLEARTRRNAKAMVVP